MYKHAMDRGKLEGYECALEVIICDCGFEFILTEMLENRVRILVSWRHEFCVNTLFSTV